MSCPAGLAKHEYVIAAVGYSRTWLSRFIGAGVAAVTVALKNLVGSAAADSAPRRLPEIGPHDGSPKGNPSHAQTTDKRFGKIWLVRGRKAAARWYRP